MAFAGTTVQCAVCGDIHDVANGGSNFAPSACKPCVNFFNLGFRGRGCKSGGSCALTRTACISCRYNKCKEVGVVSKIKRIRESQDNVEKVSCPQEELSKFQDCNERLEINKGQSIDSVSLKLETFLEEGETNSFKPVEEDSDIKLANHIMRHLGLSSDIPFDTLTEDNQTLAGNRLELILGIVGSGALVSLINCILNDSDVKKLASMRGFIAKESLLDLNVSKLPENMSIVCRDNPFSCPKCDYKTPIKKDLQHHVKAVHNHVKEFSYGQCDFQASCKYLLRDHVKAIHDKIKDHYHGFPENPD